MRGPGRWGPGPRKPIVRDGRGGWVGVGVGVGCGAGPCHAMRSAQQDFLYDYVTQCNIWRLAQVTVWAMHAPCSWLPCIAGSLPKYA